jgi:hypothetical protein
MKVIKLVIVKKNHKNVNSDLTFQAEAVELCRSGLFSSYQLLSQMAASALDIKILKKR